MSWPTRKVFALVLAAFVAAGLGLSAVQASDMAVKMSMSSDMDMSHEGGCAPCPDEGSDGGKMFCPPLCVVPVFALAPQGLSAVAGASPSRIQPAPCIFLHGRQQSPDPYPPRTTGLA
jgi:hypothetical protein